MGAQTAPQWLLPAFVRSVTAIGGTASREEIEAAGRRLLDRWCSVERHHHGVTHLVAVLQRVDALAQETHDPEVVRVAAWYHGAVFDTTLLTEYMRAAGENKPASAELAMADLLALGVPERVATRVRDIILSLVRHDADPTDVDCMVMCDADLGTLAVEPQKYKEYRTRVREEFAHIDPRRYVEARIAIITRLLARRRIFLSPLAAVWEEPARQNLAAELQKLKAELATYPPAVTREAAPPPETVTAPRSKPTTTRFARDDSRVPGEHTQTLPRIPAVAPGQVPSMTPARIPVSELAAAADEEESPEVIGVPYEQRTATAARRDQVEVTSGIERVPHGLRDVPRRVSTPSAPTPSAPSPSTSSPTAATPAEAPDRRAEERRSSTDSVSDDESTGTLFRPVVP